MNGPGPQTRRLRRELETVRVMIGIYCRGHHAGRGALCGECAALWGYASERVDRCPFGVEKPTCAVCTVHCYKPSRREQIRQVMRYAGPRMMWRHPLLTIFHFIDQTSIDSARSLGCALGGRQRISLRTYRKLPLAATDERIPAVCCVTRAMVTRPG